MEMIFSWYNGSMSDLTSQVVENSKNLNRNFNRRGASTVVINGQEFYSRGKGEHNFWLTLDNDMEFVSSMKFKLVCGSGRSGGGGGGGASGVVHGTNTYKSYREFMDKYPPGTYVDVDGAYGAQCWDYADAFWLAQVNRTLVTKPGGGSACDCWNYSLDANKVGFTVIGNWADLKPGDWAFWDCDATRADGHVAMCTGPRNGDNTYPFYGQNQGGLPVASGGRAVSQANIGPAGFLGALRYNGWS